MFSLILDANLKDNFEFGLGGYVSSGSTNMMYLDAKYKTLSLYSLDVDLNGYIGRAYNSGMASVKFELPSKVPVYLKLMGVFSRKKYYESERLFVQKEAPIDLSNVMYVHKGKPTRIGFKVEGEGKDKKKVRFAKSTGEVID